MGATYKIIRQSEGTIRQVGKNTTYEMRGTFEAVTINQPAFGS
jgi:hypothetical protein